MADATDIAGNAEASAYARLSGNLYALMMECFRRPTLDFVQRGRSGALCKALRAAFAEVEGDPSIDKGLALMRDAVELPAAEGDDAALRLRLEVDYNRLFVGPDKLLAPPYESVYLSKRDVLGDKDFKAKAVIDPLYIMPIKEGYRASGFIVSPEYIDFQDHIALELEYVAFLWGKAADALEAGDGESAEAALRDKDEFLGKHLARWIDVLCERVSAGSTTGFYAGAALVCRRLVAMDAAG